MTRDSGKGFLGPTFGIEASIHTTPGHWPKLEAVLLPRLLKGLAAGIDGGSAASGDNPDGASSRPSPVGKTR